MNKETMRKHYEVTPKETLINILISSREQVDKLQKRNKERKQEIERLHSIIKEVRDKIKEFCWDYEYETYSNMTSNEVKELAEILDKEKK